MVGRLSFGVGAGALGALVPLVLPLLRRRAARARLAGERRGRLERLARSLELTALVDETLEYAATLVGVDAARIEVWHDGERPDSVVASTGLDRGELERHSRVLQSLRQSSPGLAELRLDVDGGGDAEALAGALVAPFGSDAETLVGNVAVFWRRDGVRPDERSVDELRAVAQALSTATARRERLAPLTKAPARDRLTGLHDRRFFESDLEREVARGLRGDGRFALLVVDIDDFSQINARLGRHDADAVLAEVAGRLAASIRSSDGAARLLRDEFAFVLLDTGSEGASRVFERFLGVLGRGSGLTNVAVTASAGAAEFAGDAPTVLVDRARRALRKAQQAGKGRIVVEPPLELG